MAYQPYNDAGVESAITNLQSIAYLSSLCTDAEAIWFLAESMQEQVSALSLAFYGPGKNGGDVK